MRERTSTILNGFGRRRRNRRFSRCLAHARIVGFSTTTNISSQKNYRLKPLTSSIKVLSDVAVGDAAVLSYADPKNECGGSSSTGVVAAATSGFELAFFTCIFSPLAAMAPIPFIGSKTEGDWCPGSGAKRPAQNACTPILPSGSLVSPTVSLLVSAAKGGRGCRGTGCGRPGGCSGACSALAGAETCACGWCWCRCWRRVVPPACVDLVGVRMRMVVERAV